MFMRIKKFLPLILIVVAMVAVYASGLLDYFNLEQVKQLRDSSQSFLDQYYALGCLLFILAYAATVALSLPTALLLSLLGGALFGPWYGTLHVIVGATTGATIIFLAARSALGDVLRARANKFYNKVKNEMAENAISYMLFLRLVPLFPFFVVNILPALFPIKLRDFIWTTAIGILPGTFVYVNLGAQLADIDKLSDLISTDLLLAFTLLGMLALTPTIIKKIRGKKLPEMPDVENK